MRQRLEHELQQLHSDLIRMGADVESAIQAATQTLCTGDVTAAETATTLEVEVDRLEQTIETRSLRLLLQEQPVAGDLRLVSAALKIITDLERIGDQAANIAMMSLRHPEIRELELIHHLRGMGEAAEDMAGKAIDAFVARDMPLAMLVVAQDDQIDRLFAEVKKGLITTIRENTGDVEAALNLFLIAKYYERIGDHVVNIAEWLRYAITGEPRNDEKR